MACRDCSRCTTPGCLAVFLWPWWWCVDLCLFWRRRCPVCRCPLDTHARRADGSFKD